MDRPPPRAPRPDVSVPGSQELVGALERLAGQLRHTPVIDLETGLGDGASRALVKLELLQHTGSFKARGALNALLSESSPAGVAAASGGNHGAAVAWAAARCGVPAAVFVPASSPALKAARIRSYGADLHVVDGQYADALKASLAHSSLTGARQVHAYDDPAVVAGQASLGFELLEQLEESPAAEANAEGSTTVLVSCGGGGLYAGVSLACAGRAIVLPVEPELAPTLCRAVEARRPVAVEVSGTAVESLGARYAGEIATSVALSAGIRPVLVSDEDIQAAQSLLWERLRVIAEPGGATALAALVGGAYRPAPGETVVAVVSGANTSSFPAT